MAENQTFYDQSTIYELQKWLECLYCDEPCPIVDPEKHDIELLLKIKSRNEEADKDAKEIIDANKNLVDFYNTKSLEIESMIDSLEVSLNDDTMKKIESLSELAVAMDLSEPDLTNFLLGITDMRIENSKQHGQKLKNRHQLSCLSKKVVDIEKQNEILGRKLEKLQGIVNRQNSSEAKINQIISTMSKKSAEYEGDAELYQNSLKHIKFEDSLRHNALVDKAATIQAFQKEVKKKVDKLNSYKALPPNPSLAKIEVQKKKQELENLTKKFTTILEAFENSAAEEP